MSVYTAPTRRNGAASIQDIADLAGEALGAPTPGDHGLAAWSYDPAHAVNSSVLTAGTLYLVALYIPVAVVATKLYFHVAVVASTVTSGQNFVGLYDAAGARLATAGVDGDITSTGVKAITVAPRPLVAGETVYGGFVFNATTPPAFSRTTGLAGAAALVNVGLSAASYRFATNGTGQTSLPASVTPAAASQGLPLWAAVG